MTGTTRKSLAGLAMAACMMVGMQGLAQAKETRNEGAPKTKAPQKASKAVLKSKQCVLFFSPEYKKLRIKPIKFEFRWCDKSKKNDCSKWKHDTVADLGKAFSIVGHCMTYARPLHMELRYNKNTNKEVMSKVMTITPHRFALKNKLAPHAYCTTKSIHHFKIRRHSILLKTGKPRRVIKPECVWKPIK